MAVLGIIPARFASTRFPGKPLIDILGRSMISRVYDQCKACPDLDEVIVATDDERIYQHLEKHGAKVMMTSKEHVNGTERIAEVANHYENFDLIVNIQGDEPCIHPKQITDLVSMMQNSNCSIGTQAKRISNQQVLENPNAVKAVFEEGVAVDFFRDAQGRDDNHCSIGKHIGIYAFRRKTLLEIVELKPTERELELRLEQIRWMDNGYDIAIGWTAYESPSVDVPEDLDKLIAFMRKNEML